MSRARGPLLLLFLRAPRLGGVKRRLAAGVGEERALAIYRRLAEGAVAAARAAAPELTLRLLFTPDGAGAEVRRWLGGGEELRAQGEGELGERLERAFTAALAEGHAPVLAVGSDLPDLRAADLRAALAALDGAEAVVGPAEDGGYWLIGARRLPPRLFREISWSTPRVLSQTLARLRDAGVEPALLRTLRDVDQVDDLPEGWG